MGVHVFSGGCSCRGGGGFDCNSASDLIWSCHWVNEHGFGWGSGNAPCFGAGLRSWDGAVLRSRLYANTRSAGSALFSTCSFCFRFLSANIRVNLRLIIAPRYRSSTMIRSFQVSSAEISRSKSRSWLGPHRITRRSQSGSPNICSSPRTIAYLGSSAIRVVSRVWSLT